MPNVSMSSLKSHLNFFCIVIGLVLDYFWYVVDQRFKHVIVIVFILVLMVHIENYFLVIFYLYLSMTPGNLFHKHFYFVVAKIGGSFLGHTTFDINPFCDVKLVNF
jgi:heme/copper-type cytochrome/quinol oxidase subunit 4